MEEKVENKILPTETSEENFEQEIHYKEMSPAQMVLRRFFRSSLSIVGVIMLVALFAFAFIGPPIMHALGYQWEETETDHTPTLKRAMITIEGVKAKDAEGNVLKSARALRPGDRVRITLGDGGFTAAVEEVHK